jgi:hypothetical protein
VNSTTFLVWFDSSKRSTVEDKINDARHSYQVRYGAPANVVYVHPTQVVAVAGVEVKPRNETQRDTFWVGHE